MQHQPLLYEEQGTGRKTTGHDAIAYPHGDFKLTVDGVNMWRVMVSVKHGDGDAKKSADDRHGEIHEKGEGKRAHPTMVTTVGQYLTATLRVVP